jgi:hypothetical protein
MNDEVEGMYKEAVTEQSRYYPRICLVVPRKNKKTPARIGGALAEIRTQHLPNTKVEYYCYGTPDTVMYDRNEEFVGQNV